MVRSRGNTTVVLTKDVPARLAESLGLADKQQRAGATVQLPHSDAVALIQAGVGAFGPTGGG